MAEALPCNAHNTTLVTQPSHISKPAAEFWAAASTLFQLFGRRLTAWTDLIRPLAMVTNAVLAFSALASLVPTSLTSVQEPLPFRYYKSIELSESPDNTIVRVPLDSDVYAATRAQFPDVRVFNAKGIESPFRVETYHNQPTRNNSQASRKRNLIAGRTRRWQHHRYVKIR